MPKAIIRYEEFYVYMIEEVDESEAPHYMHVNVSKRLFEKYTRLQEKLYAMQVELAKLYRD